MNLILQRFLFLFLWLFSVLAEAQDTLNIVHYNLLNYGNITTYCTNNNNNIDQKDAYLKTIIAYTKPDVFTVNEMGASLSNAQRILSNVLNVNGINYYARAGYQNFSGGSLANMLFYDSRKLTLLSQNAIPTSTRDFNFYTFQPKIPSHVQLADTAYITFIVVHLKAGTTSSDATERASMTQTLMNYLAANNLNGNYVLMGDMNLYNSSEQAYQNLINYSGESYRFYDPVNKQGSWHENSLFADWHTQSTSSSGNGCMSSGGLDDRFDFILASKDIMQGNRRYTYVPGSYKTIGNDGLHYNTSIVSSPTNSSVPANVLSALSANSDHLPVQLKIKSDTLLSVAENEDLHIHVSLFPNPASDYLTINISASLGLNLDFKLLNLTGQKVSEGEMDAQSTEHRLSLQNIPAGIYFLHITEAVSGISTTKKLIINR